MYFIIKNHINYFIVVDKKKSGVSRIARDSTLLIKPKKELFVKLKKNYNNIKNDIEE